MQQALVFIIVAIAITYAAWRWMPQGWRHALALRLVGGSRHVGMAPESAERMLEKLSAPTGCGACARCGGCAGDTKQADPDHPA
ncbi:MAG TPA: hypothetical protein VGC24_06085 [Burkholderiaceae bacterium]